MSAPDASDDAAPKATQEPQPAAVRPARKQVSAPVTGHEEKHDPGTFNIWSGRKNKGWGGGRDREKGPRQASAYRCRPKVDTGRTRGDAAGVAYCCLYFARGLCHHGSDCNYLHRVPAERDEARHGGDYGHDIFGRERAPESRDGRKRGVGSYERECRTLYVGYGGAGTLPPGVLRELLRADFEEWGPIADLHVAADKAIAFVRYTWRSSAEFAKAAMHQQSLMGSTMGEVLDVRWANDDPNPTAVRRVHREREEATRDAYMQAVETLDPEVKKARLQALHLAATLRPGPVAAYPDTDGQYGGGSSEAVQAYHHTYSGWDAYQFTQAQRQVEEQEQQGEGWPSANHHQQYGGGTGQCYPLPGVIPADDINRYLRPEDLVEGAQQSSWQADQAGELQHGEQQEQGQQDGDEVARGALLGLGDYGGSSSENEVEDGGREPVG